MTIVQALQQLIASKATTETNFEDIVVKVGPKAPYQTKQFKGKLLAVKKERQPSNRGWSEYNKDRELRLDIFEMLNGLDWKHNFKRSSTIPPT